MGSGSLSDLIAGIEWCIRNLPTLNIRVFNLSLGTMAQAGYALDPLCRAVTIAVKKGITVCTTACSNISKTSILNSPGIAPDVITVGNLNTKTLSTEADLLSSAPYANSLKPDLIAPGTEITSLKTKGGYRTISGTSMATSLVTGGAALVLQKYPNLRPYQIKKLLTTKAKNLGIGANLQGAGLLNLEAIFGRPRKQQQSQANKIKPANQIFRVLLNLIGRFFQKSLGANNILMNLLLSLVK